MTPFCNLDVSQFYFGQHFQTIFLCFFKLWIRGQMNKGFKNILGILV